MIPRASGLPDAWFEHDGQITKREIRAMTLSALAPRRGELLWDIGAGSGSVAIEWMLADPANRAIAIERHPNAPRASRATPRRLAFPASRSSKARRPRRSPACRRRMRFSSAAARATKRCSTMPTGALATGGRLVVNAVTLQGQAELVRRFERQGGDLVQANIARADRVGRFHGWRPAMPVVQWTLEKPWPE